MYSIKGYGSMIADTLRTDAYVEAVRRAVKPGSVVLDIGTGTGFFAVLACRFGAARVYAVEYDDVISLARNMAAANDCAETIEFMQAMSTDIRLPEQADVIVSDLRGVLPYFQNHLPSVIDARRRFLAPGGVLIPRLDTLWLACVDAPDLHRSITTPWSDRKYGLDMRAAIELRANQWCRASLKPEQMMTPPECCASIDYATIESPNLDARVNVTAMRAGTAHGLCVWFDTTLAEGIHFSNSPEDPELIYGKAFFPWPEPVALDAGDAVAVSLKSNLIGGESLWSWETRVYRKADPRVAAFHFRQSEFFGETMSRSKLGKLTDSHIPSLNEDGQIDCLILTMMRDEISLGNIAHRLVALHPGRFSRWQDALTRVAKLSSTYDS